MTRCSKCGRETNQCTCSSGAGLGSLLAAGVFGAALGIGAIALGAAAVTALDEDQQRQERESKQYC
jgi:hypothetical protein